MLNEVVDEKIHETQSQTSGEVVVNIIEENYRPHQDKVSSFAPGGSQTGLAPSDKI